MIPESLSRKLNDIFRFNIIELSLTNFCELTCQGCPSLDANDQRIQAIDYSSLMPFLNRLYSNRVVLCGGHGEPTLYKEFGQLLYSLSKSERHEVIHISTNGESVYKNLVPEQFDEKQKEKIIFQVAIDGHTNKIHELTRKGGNLESVKENVKKLKNDGFKVEIVSTRHFENEKYSKDIVTLVRLELDEDVHFRDTTHLTKTVKPPSKTSKRGDVSILYQNKDSDKVGEAKYVPREDFLYVDYDGSIYPCPSFIKFKTNYKAPILSQTIDPITSLKEFFDFRKQFCQCYQKLGDRRQCVVNCGSYRKFDYDYIEDIEELS